MAVLIMQVPQNCFLSTEKPPSIHLAPFFSGKGIRLSQALLKFCSKKLSSLSKTSEYFATSSSYSSVTGHPENECHLRVTKLLEIALKLLSCYHCKLKCYIKCGCVSCVMSNLFLQHITCSYKCSPSQKDI